MPTRSWIDAGLPAGAYDALAGGLPASRLWSLLLEVAAARAAERRTADVVAQWERDRFVKPSIVEQRILVEIDRHVLAAAAGFEAIELSPVAPLGACSVMGRASQNKVLSALRGTEVVADPTNVLALECAQRLRRNRAETVRLATSHRCVRTQQLPDNPAFTASFRMFCLATAGLERGDHAVVAEAVAEQVAVLLRAFEHLEQHGFRFPNRRVTILATDARAALGDRIAAAITGTIVERAPLDHPYYSGGVRFQINAAATTGEPLPLADGGAFDWVATLMSNRKAVFVASGLGTQLAALLFRAP
jgi:hypothetical protein